MDKKRLAERILGAVLVCAFGFILYSAFLDHERAEFVDRNTQIPPQTSFQEPLQLEQPDVAIKRPAKTADEMFLPEQEVEPGSAQAAPVLSDGKANAWIIQVGSFSTGEKADAIRDQLIDQEYKAYHRQVSSGDEQLYRVLVGPYTNAEEAVRHQRALDSLLDISTLLMKFEP